jgi:hypothetical protein
MTAIGAVTLLGVTTGLAAASGHTGATAGAAPATRSVASPWGVLVAPSSGSGAPHATSGAS